MTDPNGRPGPLDGLRVVDFGHYFAAPMAAGLLADQGAQVVRILAPGMAELPDAQMRVLNRNKSVVPLDLKSSEGRKAAQALAARADVVIESFRPGVMARLGLDYESLRNENPGLIYLSLPGFPSTDAERAGIQAWEGVVSAAAALYTNGMRQRLNFPPLHVPAPICSAFASMHGAIGVLSALLARDETGSGTLLEVPLVNAGISTCTRSFVYDGAALRAAAKPSNELPPFLQSLAIDADDDPAAVERKLDGLAALAPPIFTTHQYRTSDARRLQVMPIKPDMARRFFEILGLDLSLQREGFIFASPWDKLDLGEGNNLASSWTLTRENSLLVIERIQEVVGTQPASHWESILAEAGIPVGVLRTREEWLATESLQGAGVLTRMDKGPTSLTVAGPVADVSSAAGVRLDATPDEPRPVDPSDVASLFSPSPPRAERKAADASPPSERKSDLLSGLEVLDLCNVVAGPNAAYTLAQFGANVVRVEPPKSFNLPMHHEWTLEVNQGKRSMIVDLGSVPGREIFAKLVRRADLVLHNRLDDVAERLGMTPEQIRQINPDAIVSQVSAFGGIHPSPWDRIPGYDPMPNMTTGLDALAGSIEQPRGMTEIFADLMSGLGAAFAGLLGLVQKSRTGVVGDGRSSLARAANFYQFPYMLSENGDCDWGQGSGRDARGDCWWQRAYRTADTWLQVGASRENRERLAEVVAKNRDAAEGELEQAFARQSASSWIETLRAAGIGCHRVLSIDDLCSPERFRSVPNEACDEFAEGPLEVLRWTDHPSGLPVLLPAPAWVQVGPRRSYRRLAPTPIVGAHTNEILAELGYDPQEIDRLHELRVVHDFLPAIGHGEAYFFEPQRAQTEGTHP